MDIELLDRLKNLNWKKALSLQLEIRPTLRGVPYWIAAVVVGFAAVLYSGMFTGAIHFAQWMTEHHPYLLLITAPICFITGSWLVKRYAEPAGGTGIPSVMAALELDNITSAHDIDYLLNLRVALVIIASSLFCSLGAGGLGREGPVVHIAACIFYFTGHQFSKLWPYQEHRSWIIAGGAAGVAAAFNTPLAGIVFVLEELAQQHFHQFKTVVISAVIVAGMIAQWLSGRYLFLGYPRIDAITLWSMPCVMLVGVACGACATWFLRTTVWLNKKTDPWRRRRRYLLAGSMGILVAALGIFVHPATAGGGINTIESLLFRGEPATWRLLTARFFGTILSHVSGCAGGFLAPALAMGAALGSQLSQWISPANHNLMVMVGMAGFLAAITRAPFTALVIVMEMTDRHSAIFPLMLTSLISVGTARVLANRNQPSNHPS